VGYLEGEKVEEVGVWVGLDPKTKNATKFY
jgi:hypothetical protein